jgi:hypothetical protein
MSELSEVAKIAIGEENSIGDIRRFFSEGAKPLQPNEFISFWQSLSDEDKQEFKHADLS